MFISLQTLDDCEDQIELFYRTDCAFGVTNQHFCEYRIFDWFESTMIARTRLNCSTELTVHLEERIDVFMGTTYVIFS